MPGYIKKMIPSIVILILDAVLIALIPSQVKELSHDMVTTRFMPYVVTAMIALCAAADIIELWLKERKNKAPGKKYFDKKGFLRVVGCMLCLAVYLMAMPTVGFVLDSAILCALVMLLMGNRKPVQIIVMSIVLPVLVYCMFKLGLSLRLPTGLFFF